MDGQRVGYVRVSSFDQNPDRQLEAVSVVRTFTDKASGKDTRRPELDRLLAFVRDGDTVAVHSMDRLARNLDDLRRIVQDLTKRGVRIELCGATAKAHHWGNVDLLPGIKVNLDAMARTTQLVQEGFVKITE